MSDAGLLLVRASEALYAAVSVLLALSGPRRFSVDRLLCLKVFDAPWLRYLSLGAVVTGAAFMLTMRRKPEPSAETPPQWPLRRRRGADERVSYAPACNASTNASRFRYARSP